MARSAWEVKDGYEGVEENDAEKGAEGTEISPV